MSQGGRGDRRSNRRRPFRRREQDRTHSESQEQRGNEIAANPDSQTFQNSQNRTNTDEHSHWLSSRAAAAKLPVPECPYCNKPIKDLSTAISDKNSDQAVHFDCIISRLSQSEKLEQGDVISYLGGGRFGIVHFGIAPNSQSFVIKKIFEWENKENRAEWREAISNQFLVT